MSLSLQSVMGKTYFKSYIWLLEMLQSRGPMTLRQLQELWRKSSINEEKKSLAPRTFANHIASIADIFGIDIVCDRRTNKYSIDNEGDIGGDPIRTWMLDVLSTNSLLSESAGLRDRVFFEDVPSGRKFLAIIIQAIRDGKKVKVRYKSYRKDSEETLVLEPYFLKEFKRRWYLYAYKGDSDGPHMLALDRMLEIQLLPDSFKLPKKFSAADYFLGIYGTRVYPNMKKEKVLLKVSPMQSHYFRSLPLHASQKELETHDDYSIFSYDVTIDFDFRQDVLSFGSDVEVLSPEVLRRQMAEIANNLSKKYGYEQTKEAID